MAGYIYMKKVDWDPSRTILSTKLETMFYTIASVNFSILEYDDPYSQPTCSIDE